MSQLHADFILVVHALYVAFVVIGLVLIVVGVFRNWPWIRNAWFRTLHLLAIGIVVVQTWLGKHCPLTVWESRLRRAADEAGYTGSFVQHWLHNLLFCDFAPWVFTLAYTLFGIMVALTWALAPPRWTRSSGFCPPAHVSYDETTQFSKQ